MTKKQKLSIIVPVYNEEKTIREIIKRLNNLKLINNLKSEIIVVDDCSTDNSRRILNKCRTSSSFKIILKDKNEGKGSAVIKGFNEATGDILVIQDADLEYNPKDLNKLLKVILKGSKVVYGSRFKSDKGNFKKSRLIYYLHYLGNWFLTISINLLYKSKLTDMETCYKMFTKEVLNKMCLRSKKFEIEPEITAKILKNGFKIKEVSISYYSRDFDEGKKITWKDGISALFNIIKYRFMD